MKKIKLSIPTPCHEDWNKMTEAAKGKFCGSCQKEVIDFSTMSESQIVAFFKKPGGSVCGRFRNDQLDLEMTIPAKRVPWAKYFFQIALPAFLFSCKSNAQVGKVMVTGDTVLTPASASLQKLVGRVVPSKLNLVLYGKVTDSEGNGIPFASVMIKGTNDGVACDSAGTFSVTTKKYFPIVLEVSSVGYSTVEYETASGKELAIRLEKKQLEDVVVTSSIITKGYTIMMGGIKRTPSVTNFVDTLVRKVDTLFSKFTVYPNPATTSETVFAEISKLQKGKYYFSLTNMLGQEMRTEIIELDGYIKRKQIDVSNLTPGTYVLKFQHQQSGKISSQKLIINNRPF